ncbi:MAG TPA: hypothetical protein VLJ15_07845 [Gammaproteobacteria bacterium]|nr:hypothetical protein [Gammaproteobacteria bacterium]
MIKQTSSQSSDGKTARFLFLSCLPLVLIILAIWLPYGFTTGTLLEEWGTLALFEQAGPIFFTHLNGPLAAHALRPLTVLPHSLAYLLNKNSLDYWHVITILSLIIKGLASAWLTRAATGSRFWGIVAGCLVLLFPADTMQLALRGIGINSALALVLLGGACSVAAFQNPRRIVSYSLGVLSFVFLLTSILIYEAGYSLFLLPFLILFVRFGLADTLQFIKSRLLVTVLWLAPFIIYPVYCFIVASRIQSYQASLIAGSNPVILFLHYLPKLFSIGIVRSLLGGWFDALRMTIEEYSRTGYLWLFVITGLLAGFLLFILKTDIDTHPASSTKKWGRLAVVGMVLLMFGYAPSLLVPAHLDISQRTFLFATFGAVMVWIAFLAILFRAKKWIALLLIFFLILIGLGAQLFQFEHYARLSMTQRYLLKNIIENVDGNLKGNTLVILDKSNQLDKTWMLPAGYLGNALTYFYQQPIASVDVCYNRAACSEKKITVTIQPDGSVTPVAALEKYRNQLRDSNTPGALRYRAILIPQPGPFSRSLWRTVDPSQYKWQFGDWWSLDLPIKGSGWNEAVWTVHYFHHEASAWKKNKQATLLFNLQPAEKPYILKGKFVTILTPAIQNSMRVSINGHLLKLEWKKDNAFQAVIPMKVLVSGVNTIEFDSDVDKASGLSAALQRFEILTAPVKP